MLGLLLTCQVLCIDRARLTLIPLNVSEREIRRCVGIGATALLLNIDPFPHQSSIFQLELIFQRVKALHFDDVTLFAAMFSSHI